MFWMRTLFASALLVPFLSTSLQAQTAKKMDVRAARAECFRQANAAANSVSVGFSGATADRQALGMDAYRDCCRKMGIRP
ncbi:hypothetical protein GA0061098_100118 [Bradyrhizobium shewense]|uniref:Uncharacterized protein n=1 Tax=Bradyrhizobium shewense TaxID=1761772 RepID=A0A1C3TVU7_9BRAD|nr:MULTISPECIES: hypothetical protein [Bradyrhizobium]SCB07370.1 hypothetical protein GA0061098_100118 [Bradyrhizobium shewense]